MVQARKCRFVYHFACLFPLFISQFLSFLLTISQLIYSPDARSYLSSLDTLFDHASRTLLSLLLSDRDLLGHLQALKRFFLNSCGSMLVTFMDMADDELLKGASHVRAGALQLKLELAMRMSGAAHSEELRVALAETTLTSELDRINETPRMVRVAGAAEGEEGKEAAKEAVKTYVKEGKRREIMGKVGKTGGKSGKNGLEIDRNMSKMVIKVLFMS